MSPVPVRTVGGRASRCSGSVEVDQLGNYRADPSAPIKARLLAAMGPSYLAETRSALGLSFDLRATATDDDRNPAVVGYFPYFYDARGAELAGVAAECLLDLAADDPGHAAGAERHALHAVAGRDKRFARSGVFDQVNLARSRFLLGEPVQAAADGAAAAMALAVQVSSSVRVRSRLSELLTASEPYRDAPPCATSASNCTARSPRHSSAIAPNRPPVIRMPLTL